MYKFKLPSEGLTILHNHTTSKDSTSQELPQIIRLDLLESATRDIFRSIKNNEQVRLKLGKKPSVQYGRKQLSLGHVSENFPSEVFVGPLDGSEPVYFSGKLSHTLEVLKAKQDTAKSDEALAALENTLKSLKEQQASNEVSFMGSKNELKKKDTKPTVLSNRDRLRGTTTPSSPFMASSPRLGPTSNPLLSTTPSKDKIRLDAMRIPLVHLLAMGPMSSKAIAKKLNTSQSDCDKALNKIVKDANSEKKDMKDRCFRELDVWKFPYPNKEDRDAAIERAVHAYDRMRVDKNDQLWQLLLPTEERGKGKVLSRLNFEARPPAPTPKAIQESDGKGEVSDKEGKLKKSKPALDSKPVAHKKKLSGDSVMKKRIDKPNVKPPSQPTKLDGKFKSSERIEDSDEEAEGVEVIPAKTKALKPMERERNIARSPRPSPNPPVNIQHKSKLSTSSSSSNDLDRSRLREENSKLKPRSKGECSPTASRISPRPRTGSSPQKPSPLGSSPPTNSTDLENSSKGSTQSSAPSSPPSSTDMPLSQARKNYSPVITGKGRSIPDQVKRKAEKGEEPPKKRQQVHGLGLSKAVTERMQHSTSDRRPSDSSISSPDKPAITKESIVDATLQFRTYYIKYKDLHEKLARQQPDERSDEKLEKLRQMHERLEKLKSELWSDWEKAGGEMPV